MAARANRLGNLQLLEGAFNNEKRAKLPAEWLRETHPDVEARKDYVERHRLGEVPEELDGFLAFYEARRERLKQLIARMIND